MIDIRSERACLAEDLNVGCSENKGFAAKWEGAATREGSAESESSTGCTEGSVGSGGCATSEGAIGESSAEGAVSEGSVAGSSASEGSAVGSGDTGLVGSCNWSRDTHCVAWSWV